ncbi:MAG TPA: transglutaminase-like domain-containing protein, partial [Acidimicrobiales bacterium]|nr:transglutaminase-like domain-containing protein [Acidimicrobiales bacterium]
VDALTTFLFTTREGYCQQFAASFAVLARELGIPTRLAIGFTTGRAVGHDTYQVTDADVHTWPEVWFPRYGWVPFEPTKGSGTVRFSIPGTSRYAGRGAARPRGIGARHPTTTTPGTTQPTTPTTSPTISTPTNPHLSHGSAGPHVQRPDLGGGPAASASAPVTAPHVRRGGVAWIGYLVAAAAALLLATTAAGGVLRRLRRRRRRGRVVNPATPDHEALVLAWAEVADALCSLGLVAELAETRLEFALRASRSLRAVHPGGYEEELVGAAGAVDAACWSGWSGLDVRSRDELSQLAGRLRRTARASTPAWKRVLLAFDPRTTWRPSSVVSAGAFPADVSALPMAGPVDDRVTAGR